MSYGYYLLLAERLEETEVVENLLMIKDFEAYTPETPDAVFSGCTAPGLDIRTSNRELDDLENIYDHFGVRVGLIVSFEITKDIDLYDTGAINMLTAVQLLLSELSCDAALLFNFDDCLLRRIDGEITLYPGGIWAPGVEPDLLSRVTFPYRFEKTRYPLPP
jgi:hypothetical protein